MCWPIYTPSTLTFEGVGVCGSAEECKILIRSYTSHPSAKFTHPQTCTCFVCVLSARLSLELSEYKVYLPCEVILERIKLYKVHRKPWGLIGSLAIVFYPPAWCGVARTLYAGDVETTS
jgi:hypothetical protein